MQEVFLFSGDVKSNIRLNNAAITDNRVHEALSAIHADDFIKSLPGGIDERVFERGCTFSSGQKQLISFARAIAADPSVLVLDEATATIDTQTEKAIQNGLEALCKNRTSIVIAHRLSTIRKADRIIVINKGIISEAGTHLSLMGGGGMYARMNQTQTNFAL
jgi:ATP-binding cassette subfamily B protein